MPLYNPASATADELTADELAAIQGAATAPTALNPFVTETDGGVALETPTGVVNGVNDDFVFSAPPILVFRNGVLQSSSVYTIVGTTVTFDTPPASGEITGLTQ